MNLKLARYRLSRRMTFRGLPISVETDKGELRHWFDPHENKSGTTKMRHPYGYIRRTEGVDGDHVDCYVGPNERAKNVYIVHQMKAPEFKVFDEDKCMLGFLSAEDAKKAYLAHYNKPGFFGSMTTMPFEEFEKKVKATFDAPKKIAQEVDRFAALHRALHSRGRPGEGGVAWTVNRAMPDGGYYSIMPATQRGTPTADGWTPVSDGQRVRWHERTIRPGVTAIKGAAASSERTMTRRTKYANLAKVLESPVSKDIMEILMRPSPAVHGTLEIGAKGRRLIPMPPRVPGTPPPIPTKVRGASPMVYEPGDILTSAKISTFLKRAQVYGSHLATVAFRKHADAALGDPNFWQGGTDAMNAPPPPPATAEDAIQLLPGGSFQGLNIRVTPDGQRSTTVKATPEAMQDPSGLNAIFAAEPGAKVELANPETAVPGTQVPMADNGGVPAGSPGQQTAPVSTIPEAAGGAGDPGIGKVAAIIRAGREQALEKMASRGASRLARQYLASSGLPATPEMVQTVKWLHRGSRPATTQELTRSPLREVAQREWEKGVARGLEPLPALRTPEVRKAKALAERAEMLRDYAKSRIAKTASMSPEDRLRKIGPAIGATAGIVSAALSRQPMTAAKVLGRVGGGATVGWLPDIYASGYEALR